MFNTDRKSAICMAEVMGNFKSAGSKGNNLDVVPVETGHQKGCD